MEQLIVELGFSQKEAKIYLALLELGTATVSEIAERSGINRTTLYGLIPELVRDGLVISVGGTKTETYSAADPEKLPLVIETKARALSQKAQQAKVLLGELRLIASRQPGKPKVRLYEGKEGIKSLYEETLLSHEEIRSFSSTESLESFDQNFLHDYYQRRAQAKIFIKAIINDTPSAWEYKDKDKQLHRELRAVPEHLMDINPEIYVYDNKVAIFSLKERFGVEIESYDIAQALKRLYDLAWDKAGELQDRLQTEESRNRAKLSPKKKGNRIGL